jgi:hypothetical protein
MKALMVHDPLEQAAALFNRARNERPGHVAMKLPAQVG